MRRQFIAAATALLVSVPVAAQAPEPGRFEIAPSADGFIRLDTRTGATSHCSRTDGIWRCEPLLEAEGALAAEIGSLAAEVERIGLALADLESRVGALAAAPDSDARAPTAEAGVDRPRGVIATAVERLFALVRAMKYGRAEAA